MWNMSLNQTIIAYNNTKHAETKLSPSECLLEKAHAVMPENTLKGGNFWNRGHPPFFHLRLEVCLEKSLFSLVILWETSLNRDLLDHFSKLWLLTQWTSTVSTKVECVAHC